MKKATSYLTTTDGAFVENYVAQELVAHGLKDLYYWTSKNEAEVDFIVSLHDHVMPLEVKAGISKEKPPGLRR